MNVIKFVKPNVKEGKKYKGEISRYEFHEEFKVLRIYVVLDKVANVEFMKRVDVDFSVGSVFATFCINMGIYFEDDTADLDELIGSKVIVVLKKGSDDKYYINKIQLDKEYNNQE